MRHINPGKVALSVGAVLGLWHLTWVTIVALGWAKPVMDFILRLHFINLQVDIAPFAIGTAVSLVAITFAIGAVIGFVFALVWNWLGTESAPQASRKTATARGG